MSTFQRGEDLRVNALGLPAGAYVLTLCDVQGRVLDEIAGKCAGELQTEISVNGLSGGLYLLKLEMKGLRMRKKVMIFAE